MPFMSFEIPWKGRRTPTAILIINIPVSFDLKKAAITAPL